MAFGLARAILPGFMQTLGAVTGLVGKARELVEAQGLDAATLIDARLAPDMLPFGYQVKSVTVHSLGAIEGVRRGQFSPDRSAWPTDFDGLGALLDRTAKAIAEIDHAEIDGLVGGDMRFVAGETVVPFLAEDFLLGFSLPNLHFHATTAYDILRSRGAPLVKRDYLGRLPVRTA